MAATRRTMIGATLAAAAAGGLKPALAMGEAKNMNVPASAAKTYVLVHGAWHGGWCWHMVADRLRAQGHRVFTPTLTGMGARHHLARPEVGLETHVTDICNVLTYEELSEVILVGHSYGGPVVEGVHDAMPERISKVVMLDASVVDPGTSMTSATAPDVIKKTEANLLDGFRLPSWPPETFAVLKEDGWVYDWVGRRLTSMPWRSLTAVHTLQNGPLTGSDVLYILCDGRPFGDPSRPALQKAKQRGWNIQSLNTGHDAMVTAPDALADMLLAI